MVNSKSSNTKRTIQLRLTPKALQLLGALATEQGLSKGAVLELLLRKAAEEVEDKMPTVYDALHSEAG